MCVWVPIKIIAGNLVKFDGLFESTGPDGIENTKSANSIDISSVLTQFKRALRERRGGREREGGGEGE